MPGEDLVANSLRVGDTVASGDGVQAVVGKDVGNTGIEVWGPAGKTRALYFSTHSHRRATWYIDDVAETGGNAGSDVWLSLFTDDNTPPFKDIFYIKRNTGNTIMGGDWGGFPIDRGGRLQVIGETRTNTAGTSYTLQVWPMYNQSGTAGSVDVQINRQETAVGSGSHKFIECLVNNVVKFHVMANGTLGCAALACASLSVSGLGGAVEVGAENSAGAGYRMLRVPN